MEPKNSYQMIGLMSGTSGDGLDMAYCEFIKQGDWSFRIIKAQTVPFPASLAKSLSHSHLFAGEELALLDVLFGKWMGQHVRSFCEENAFYPDGVASHGHTVFHQPEKGLTLQIGNGWAIQQASGLPVISDFRTLDVQLGGQGAPLVPVGDQLLFGSYDFCLNLGGIANISMQAAGRRKAFDICPFNLLLNRFAHQRGLKYDEDGHLSERGKIVPALLRDLENLPFYHKSGAKSLGRENIDQEFLPIFKKYPEPAENYLRTLVEHYCLQISRVILQYLPASAPASLLVSGGGTYHRFFMNQLAIRCGDDIKITVPDKETIDYKEALIFALLGVLRIRNENNCLSSVTGAINDNCGGTMFGFEGR